MKDGLKLVNAREYEQLKNEHAQLSQVVEEYLTEIKILKARLAEFQILQTLEVCNDLQ